VLVGHRSLPERLPARTLQTLRRVRIGLDAVSELDDRVVRQGATPREAARDWMAAHPAQVREWFAAAEDAER
jgi:glycine betaine/proline transport system substrate-binding protein